MSRAFFLCFLATSKFISYLCSRYRHKTKQMRQRRTLLSGGLHTLLYIMVVVGSFTSCTEDKVYKIGVSQCGPGQWREKVNHEMLAAQHLYEQDAKVVIACAYDDTERQIRQIDSLVESGIDLLVVAPNESAPLTEAIKEVRGKGIPVIFFDRKAETDDYTAFIGGSNIKAGRTVGEYALELSRQITNHTPIILEITATMGTSPAKERHEGFAESMKGHSEVDYQYIYSDWSSEEAYRIVWWNTKTWSGTAWLTSTAPCRWARTRCRASTTCARPTRTSCGRSSSSATRTRRGSRR